MHINERATKRDSMKILITGGTGLIGSALIPRLLSSQHRLVVLTRNPQHAAQKLPAGLEFISDLDGYNNLDEFDLVINLAGEPIFAKRWTRSQKIMLSQSRIQLTQKLSTLINQGSDPPHCFISASAMGFYGDQGTQPISEQSTSAAHFAAKLCQQWEAQAIRANTRVCCLRSGIVLAKEGGALAQMLPIYRCGLGGRLGNGQQYWAWIALEDMVNAILFLIESPNCVGAFNMVAPNPVTNAEFNQQLGRTVKRPAPAQIPSFILRLLLGERACLLLDSQYGLPTKLLAMGYQFQYPDLNSALTQIFKR